MGLMSDIDEELQSARIRLRSAYLAARAAQAEQNEAETALYDLWLSLYGSKSYLAKRYAEDRAAILADVKQVIL
jgi:hypothetical protein